MSEVLTVAKMTAKGQITIPVDVLKAIGIREGDKVMFIRSDDGTISIRNATLEAIRRAQAGFEGAAEEAGLRNEDDLVALIRMVRRERSVKD